MTVDEFFEMVFKKQPKEACLKLEGDITIDWTSRKYWGIASNSHHIELFGPSPLHISVSEDCLSEDNRQKIYRAIALASSKKEEEIGSLKGNLE